MRDDLNAAGPSTLPGAYPLKGKYRARQTDKGMKSPANGNNARKSPNHKGLRWATVRAWARRGNNCTGCQGNPWSKK